MAICVFLGHNQIYDMNMYERTMAAVDAVIQQEEEIEFTFFDYGLQSAFLKIGLWTVIKAKQRYTQKKITLTIIKPYEKREEYIKSLEENRADILSCFVDRVVSPPHIPIPESKHEDCTFALRKIRHQQILHANYLISYLYTSLLTSQNQFYQAAKLNGAMIQDVINPETAILISDVIETFPTRQRYVHQAYMEGHSRTEIGAKLNVSAPRIRQILHKSSRQVQKRLENWVFQQRFEAGPPKPHTCCFPLMDSVADYAMDPLRIALQYLEKNKLVTEFVILQEYPALEQIIAPQDTIQQFSGHRPIETRITTVGNTRQQMLAEVKALIEQSDFCICDLSATPYAEEIERYAARAKRAIIIDIGHTYTKTGSGPQYSREGI